MSITFDSNTEFVVQGSGVGTTQTRAHICSGTERILFVGTLKQNGTCSGVTYGGVSMTQINTASNTGGGSENDYLFMLVNPPSGSNNIVATFNAAAGASAIGAISYTGAKQTGQPDAQNTQTNASTTSLTTSLTTVDNNSWLVGMFRTAGSPMSAGANTTLRGTLSNIMMGDSDGAKTPAGSHSMACSQGITNYITHCFASFSPSAQNQNANFFSFF